MAADLRLTFDEVAGDIQWLIKSGYILSAEIDLAQRTLIPFYKPNQTRVLFCRSCGGANVLQPGVEAVCAYCDSLL